MSADRLSQLASRVGDVGAEALIDLALALDGTPCSGLARTVDDLWAGRVTAQVFVDAISRLMAEVDGEDQLDRGSFATPWSLARWLVEQLGAGAGETVLDPACGVGHLLVARADRYGVEQPKDWFGWDVSEPCVQATRIGLWLASGRVGRVSDFDNIRRLDALLEPPADHVDLVVSNPPFVSIRRLVRSWGRRYVDALRREFGELRGAFDLYVPFVLRSLGALKPGGRYGIILPATVWTAAYAAPAREAMSSSLQQVHRFRDRSIFDGAVVSPHVVIGRDGAGGRVHSYRSRLQGERISSSLESESGADAFHGEAPSQGSRWFATKTVPLGDVATISAGTPGYDAHRIAEGLREADDGATIDSLTFVVSSCIDPYELRFGPVRFIKRRFERPVVSADLLTDGKRRLFRRPKILVAGVCRRLEAVRDHVGVALGVGVYAIVPERVQAELLVALLNSEAISRWYRHHFSGRELSGGYFGVNCSHLRAIPVPHAWLAAGPAQTELIDLVHRREDPRESGAYAEIDALIEARIVEDLGG